MLDAPIAAVDVHRQHVLVPGDFRVRVSTGGTQHGCRPGSLDHLELRTHVYGGEAVWDLVLWKAQRGGNIWSEIC